GILGITLQEWPQAVRDLFDRLMEFRLVGIPRPNSGQEGVDGFAHSNDWNEPKLGLSPLVQAALLEGNFSPRDSPARAADSRVEPDVLPQPATDRVRDANQLIGLVRRQVDATVALPQIEPRAEVLLLQSQ